MRGRSPAGTRRRIRPPPLPAANRAHPDVIVAAVTSHFPAKAARDEYRLSAPEQRACGLPKPSLVKLGEIVTIDRRLIRKSVGRASARCCGRPRDLPHPKVAIATAKVRG